MSWTEEKVNKLKELWGKGKTASQIAEIIGGITRNAVIGKAHRLNLSAKIKTRTVPSNENYKETSENKKEDKKVRFQEPSPDGNQMVNLLSKLKTKNENNNNISNDESIKLLKEILENQIEILNILKKDSKDISGNNDI